MAEQFTFDRIQMQRLVRQLVRDELGPRESYFTRPIPQEPVIEHLAGTAYSTITAMSGNTPGTGQVQAKKFVSGTAADYADATGNLIDVLNFGGAIATGTYVVCHRHRESGKWAVDSERVAYWTGYNLDPDTTVGTSAGVVGLDTEVSQSGGFTLASDAVTVPTPGFYMFTWSGIFKLDSPTTLGKVTTWLEEDTGSGYGIVFATLRDWQDASDDADVGGSYSMAWPHVVSAAGNKYRIGQQGSAAGKIFSMIGRDYGASSFSVVRRH